LSGESWDEVLLRFQGENRSAEHDPESALIAVVEAAKKYADEAYAIMQGDASVGDVNHVRGVCFYFLKDFARAAQCFKTALSMADNPVERAEMNLRMGLAQEAAKNPTEALAALEAGLVVSDGVQGGLVEALESVWVWSSLPSPFGPAEAPAALAEHKRRIESSHVNPHSARRLAANCQENADRVAKYNADQAAADAAKRRLAKAREDLRLVNQRKALAGSDPGLSDALMMVAMAWIGVAITAIIGFAAQSLIAVGIAIAAGYTALYLPGWLKLSGRWQAYKRYRANRAELASLPGTETNVDRLTSMASRLEATIAEEKMKSVNAAFPPLLLPATTPFTPLRGPVTREVLKLVGNTFWDGNGNSPNTDERFWATIYDLTGLSGPSAARYVDRSKSIAAGYARRARELSENA
jgi:tetratricopeptide (TPR) repeat protein